MRFCRLFSAVTAYTGGDREGAARMEKEPFFPPEVTSGAVKVTLTGQGRACVEQHRGLLGYTPEEALLRTKAGTLRITGRNLRFLRYSAEDAVLTGEIESIRLEGRGAAGGER